MIPRHAYVELDLLYRHTCILLDSFLYVLDDKKSHSDEKNIGTILKKYATKYYHQYNPCGLLQKTKPGQYVLYIYQKPDRNQYLLTLHTLNLTVQENGMITTKNMDGIKVPLSTMGLDGLVLLQKSKNTKMNPIKFIHSLQTKTIVPFKMKNPFPQQHFISFVFGNRPYAIETSQFILSEIPKIKQHFKQLDPPTLININMTMKPNELPHTTHLISKHTMNLLQTGSIYIFLHGHSFSGSNYITDDGSIKWNVDDIVRLFKHIAIPKNAKIDIDTYACFTGNSIVGKSPSFVRCLFAKMKQEKYINCGIKGNIFEVYHTCSSIENHHFSLIQQSKNVATAGVLHRSLSGIINLKNTDVYQSISELSHYIPQNAKISEIIIETKQRAKEICDTSKDTLDFNNAYLHLAQLFTKFKRSYLPFEKLENICYDITVYADENKIYAGTPRGKAMIALQQYSNQLYSESKHFINAYTNLHDKFTAFKKLDHLIQTLLEELQNDRYSDRINTIKAILCISNNAYHDSAQSLDFEQEHNKLIPLYQNFLAFTPIITIKKTIKQTRWNIRFWQKCERVSDPSSELDDHSGYMIPIRFLPIWDTILNAERNRITAVQAKQQIRNIAIKAATELLVPVEQAELLQKIARIATFKR